MPSWELIPILPEALLTVAGTAVMLLGAFLRKHAERWCGTTALLGLFAAAVAVTYQWPRQGSSFDGMLLVDPFSIFFHFLFLVIAALVALFSSEYLRQERLAAGEYYALLLFATAGMGLMASANELVLIFIGLEISSLASYVLVGFRRDVSTSSESALKYFLLGSFATAFFLYGIALMFGATGTTRLSLIREVIHSAQGTVTASAAAAQLPVPPGEFPATLLALSIVLLFVGLAFKVSAAPFQVWTPDVYQGAPTPVTAFLSTGPKAAALAVFLRLFMGALETSAEQWSTLLWISGALSMLIGNLAALRQSNIKRLLAYSSIAHAGYMLVAFTAHSAAGVAAVLFYLVVYSFMNIGAFAVATHVGHQGERFVNVDDYAGLAYRSPLLAATFCIFLLSLIGIPLTGGFLGKFYVFRAALRADLVWLTVLGVLNSGVAAYYYLRIVVAMYMTTPSRPVPCEPLRPPMRAVLLVCAASTLLLGVFPQPVLDLADRAAQWLQSGGL